MRYTEEQKDIVRKYWPTMSWREISEAYLPELGKKSITYIATKVGVQHDEATQKRINKLRALNVLKGLTPESQAKKSAKYRATRRSEELRHKYGLERKTKIRFKEMSRSETYAKSKLCRLRNYIPTTNKWVLWYDENTRRTKNEDYYTQKYRLTFKEAKD